MISRKKTWETQRVERMWLGAEWDSPSREAAGNSQNHYVLRLKWANAEAP